MGSALQVRHSPRRVIERGRLVVGTSGWVYPDWEGTVYPGRMKTSEAFAYYAKHFRSVELNSSFYHFPRETTVQKWQAMGGKDFTWAVKGWRWISHIKRLKGVRPDVADFFQRVQPLAAKGVVLFQLPPSFRKDLPRLKRFLKWLPKGFRVAMEFRHPSWFDETTYDLLRDFCVACVVVSGPGVPLDAEVQTAPFSYFRLHGSSRWYDHDYSAEELQFFARFARSHLKKGDVYAYFDNTAGGRAFHNARAFASMVKN